MSDNIVSDTPATVKTLTVGLLSADQIRAWRRPKQWKAFLDFSLVWLQIFTGLAIFFAWPSVITFLIAFVLVSGGQHGLYLVAHEFVHNLVVPENRKLNDRIGNWFFCLPTLLPLEIFRHRHFIHHKKYSTEEDTKTVYRRDPRGWKLLKEVLRSISGIEFLSQIFDVRRFSQQSDQERRSHRSIVRHLPALALCQLIIFAFFCLYHPLAYFGLWLFPLVTGASLCIKIRSYMEHRPLRPARAANISGFFLGTPGPFVRTVNTNWFERLFFTKINFHFHAEHHFFPQISYQYLPRIREELRIHQLIDHPDIGFERDYLTTLYRLWRDEKPDTNSEASESGTLSVTNS